MCCQICPTSISASWVAYIGTLQSSVQAKLEKWFDLGEYWGAILLIDEADVFLESQTTASFQRNSLVSGTVISIILCPTSGPMTNLVFLWTMKLHWNAIPGMADRLLMKFDLQVLINKQTINQMGQIDDAFYLVSKSLWGTRSRAMTRRWVFGKAFEKLEDEPRDLIITQRVKTFVFTDEKFRKMNWNGPGIRNGKQLISVFRDSKA